jgi:hypothetical protein
MEKEFIVMEFTDDGKLHVTNPVFRNPATVLLKSNIRITHKYQQGKANLL